MEPLEPRLLLSADFMPAAAEAMGDGFDDLQARLDDFFDSASDLDQRVPFLLLQNPDYDPATADENDAPFEAPLVSDLFALPVDANNDGDNNDGDETVLDGWDDNHDGLVNSAELLDALLFEPLQNVLNGINEVDGRTEFVDALVNDFHLSTGQFGIDTSLDNLGPYDLEFDLVSANDLTENPDAEVAFDLQFSLTVTRDQVPVDLGLEADDLKLLAFTGDSLDPQPVTIPVDSTLTFGLEFGVYTGGQNDTYGPGDADLNANDFFIRRADDMLFSVTDDAPDNNVDFDLNIGFLGAKVVNGDIDFQADIKTNLIDPDSPEVLGFHTDQYGMEQPSGVVVADNSIPDVDLAHNAGFVLRIGNLGIATDVLVQADDNDNYGNVVDDVKGALDDVGLGDLITVDLGGVGNDHLRFSLVSTDPAPLGFDAESLSENGMLTAAGAPPDFQPLDNVSFLLSVGGALPRLVTVRAPGSERDDLGFAASEDSETVSLKAQTPANYTLAEPGETNAEFTISVWQNDGLAPTVDAISFDEMQVGLGARVDAHVVLHELDLDADLLADLNSALGASTVGGLVTAVESGGVLSLVGSGTVSAIEISGTNTITQQDLGFVDGQQALLTLTADSAIGDVTFSDGIDNTFDGARFTVTVNGSDHVIDVAADDSRENAGDLADAINDALGAEGLAVTASVHSEMGSDYIVLSADDNSVYSLEVTTGNQDLDDLLYDLNNALDAAGFSTVIASDDGGSVHLTDSNDDSLEITNTLTFDAGVRGAELDGAGDPPDASFETSVGDDSHLVFTLPVEVKEGLREAGTTSDWDPQDMAIVGNVNPMDSTLVTFVPNDGPKEVLRFNLDYDITPPGGEDPAIPVPNPPGENTLQLVNFAEALQFNLIGPGSFIGMFGELGAALDSIMQDSIFAGYDIPFANATLRDLASFEDMLRNSVIYDKGPDGEFNSDNPSDDSNRLLARVPVGGNVIVPDGNDSNPKAFEMVPTFTTAQEMADNLTEILSRPLFSNDVTGINPTYDPDSNELTFDFDLISSDRVSVGVNDPENPNDADEVFAPAFEFDVGMAPFGEFLIKPEGVETFGGGGNVAAADLLVAIEARNAFSATVGFNLTPELDPDPGDDDNLLEQRFFVRDATMRGAFTATLPDVGVEATALVGIIGVNITDIDGSYGAQFSAQLKDEGGAPGSQVTLDTLQTDIKDASIGPTSGNNDDGTGSYVGPDNNGGQAALEIVTDPVVSRLQTLEYDGQGLFDGNFEAGSEIVSESGGTAYVLASQDFFDSGTLTLFGVDGVFADDDKITDVRDVTDPPFIVRQADVNGGVTTPTFYGELDMSIAVQDGFTGTGFGANLGALDGLSGTVDLNLAVFGDPNSDIDPAIDAGDLQTSLDAIGTNVDGTFVSLGDYADVDYFDLIAALEQLDNLVADLEASYPVLSQTLPVVNLSFSDLLGLTEGVDLAVSQARSLLQDQQALLGVEGNEVPTLTLQGLANALRGAFGLPDDSTGVIVDVESVAATPYLTLDFDIEKTISTSLGLDIDLGKDSKALCLQCRNRGIQSLLIGQFEYCA